MKESEELYKENGSQILMEILASEQDDPDDGIYFTKYPGERFYFIEGEKFIAVDNTDCECYVEEFDTAEEAISWLNDETFGK